MIHHKSAGIFTLEGVHTKQNRAFSSMSAEYVFVVLGVHRLQLDLKN